VLYKYFFLQQSQSFLAIVYTIMFHCCRELIARKKQQLDTMICAKGHQEILLRMQMRTLVKIMIVIQLDTSYVTDGTVSALSPMIVKQLDIYYLAIELLHVDFFVCPFSC